MVLSTDVTQFLSSAHALYTPGSRLLIKYKGTGVLTLKVTDNKQVRQPHGRRAEATIIHAHNASLHLVPLPAPPLALRP